MGSIGASFGKLQGTSEHVHRTSVQVNGALADLKNYLKPLVANWEGAASGSYQALQAKWDASAADLNTTLARIGAALGTTAANMEATEKSNAARF